MLNEQIRLLVDIDFTMILLSTVLLKVHGEIRMISNIDK
jgi:hypothetical protein